MVHEDNAAWASLFNFFGLQLGRLGSFWVRSHKGDWVVAEAQTSGQADLTFLNSATFNPGLSRKRHVHLVRIGQDIELVTPAPSPPDDNRNFTIDPTLSANVNLNDVAENLYLVRFDSDTLTRTARPQQPGSSESDVVFSELQQEMP